LLAVATGGHALQWSSGAACLYVVEPDAVGLAAFQRRLCGCLCPNVRVLGSSPAHLPLPSGLIDLVFARLDLLLEMRDPEAVLREATRVLKPGGSFFGVDRPVPGETAPCPGGTRFAAREKLVEARAARWTSLGFQEVLAVPGATAPLQQVLDALRVASSFRILIGPWDVPVSLPAVAHLYHRRKPADWAPEL
jgi:SAM-dependent methyltransferase